MEEVTKKNTPLRCLIVDDEPIARDGMVDLIQSVDFLRVEGAMASATEAIAFIQTHPIDLLFLDVNMPYLSGLEMLETLKNPPLTILTTAYSEYALEGFRLQVVDYLLKPFTFKRFFQAVLKAQEAYQTRELAHSIDKEDLNPFLYIKQNNGFQKIIWKEILYIESMENYVKIIFSDKQLIAHQTISSMEEMLPNSSFFRIHKSFLVNIYHIDSIQGGRIFIGNKELPISRYRKEELLQSVVYKNLLGQ